MAQSHLLLILYGKYHACWCPADLRSQAVNWHGIAQIRRNIKSVASAELNEPTG